MDFPGRILYALSRVRTMQTLIRILLYLAVLLYLLSPVDLVPDLFPGLGWLDDLLLVLLTVWYMTSRRGWDAYRRAKWPGKVEESPHVSTDDPYEILGVRRGATPEEIKAAYRKAVAMYHPDKVAHLGKEFQELAHKKLIAIQQAYRTLTKGGP